MVNLTRRPTTPLCSTTSAQRTNTTSEGTNPCEGSNQINENPPKSKNASSRDSFRTTRASTISLTPSSLCSSASFPLVVVGKVVMVLDELGEVGDVMSIMGTVGDEDADPEAERDFERTGETGEADTGTGRGVDSTVTCNACRPCTSSAVADWLSIRGLCWDLDSHVLSTFELGVKLDSAASRRFSSLLRSRAKRR